MWKYFGVFFNTATVLLGALLGTILKARSAKAGKKNPAEGERLADKDHSGKLPPRQNLPEVMMTCLAFCTIFAAASGLVGIENGTQALVSVASIVLGLLLGWALRIDDRLNQFTDYMIARFGSSGDRGIRPAEGIVTATLLYCIGSMTVLGSFESAANPAGYLDLSCHTTLMIKSTMDLVSSTCLAVTYGAYIMVSGLCVLVIQGLLVLLASSIQPFLQSIAAMPAINCVGSMILLAIALNLLGLKKIKTADYLPALFMPILICWILSIL